jgi:hypothetical protein
MRRIVTPLALAVAALVGAHALAGAEPVSALRLLPIQVQKEIEEARASCRELGVRADAIYDDAGVTRFTLHGGTDAVMVNDGEVCGGERIKGANCSTGGCAVAVYARVRGAWRNVLAGRNDPFVSADWTRDPPALRILVVSLYGDAPECPVREANLRAHGSTAWKHGQCDVVARWDGPGSSTGCWCREPRHTQLNGIYCIIPPRCPSSRCSPFAVRVLVPFLRPIVVGAWCFGLGWVTKE